MLNESIRMSSSHRGCKLLDRVTYPRDPVFGGFGFGGGRAPAVTGADLLAAPGLVRTLIAIQQYRMSLSRPLHIL